jgi:hypothetical protein
MPRYLASRAHAVVGDVANRLLKPATRAETLGLYLLAVVLTGVALTLYAHAVGRIDVDERHTREQATFTRAEQVQGQPIAVCLLDVMRNVAPLLERIPTVELPLQAYVQLQGVRYAGLPCPVKRAKGRFPAVRVEAP